MKKITLFNFVFGSILAAPIMSLIVLPNIAMAAPSASADYGLEVGLHSQSGDAEGSTTTTASQTTIQFGGVVHFPINAQLSLRTGMLYTQRPLVVKSSGVDNKVSLTYLDVPVALMLKFEDYAGVFAGLSLGMNLDKSCDAINCTLSDVKTPIIPMTFGASFKFAPNLGATLYFESYGDTVAKSVTDNYTLKNYRAVGANLMITFN